MFFIAGDVGQRYGTNRMPAIRGIVQGAPLLGTALVAGTIAITGVPPFAVFVSELSILSAGFGGGSVWESCVVAALLAATFAAFFKRITGMVFGAPSREPLHLKMTLARGIAFGLPAAAMLLLGIHVP